MATVYSRVNVGGDFDIAPRASDSWAKRAMDLFPTAPRASITLAS